MPEIKMFDPVPRRRLISRLEGECEEFADGYRDGREWASPGFSDRERRHLREFRAASDGEAWRAFFRDDPGMPSSAAERLFLLMNPEWGNESGAFEEYRYNFLDWHLDILVGETGEWARGFAEGALDRWDEGEEVDA